MSATQMFVIVLFKISSQLSLTSSATGQGWQGGNVRGFGKVPQGEFLTAGRKERPRRRKAVVKGYIAYVAKSSILLNVVSQGEGEPERE